MDLLDALKKKNSSAPAQGPGKAERLFEQFLEARDHGDDLDALEYLKESMELGYVPAVGEYGNILVLGVVDEDDNTVIEEDEETGFEYELQAADQGYLPSMVRVGLYYFQGCGTEADIDEATRYWEMALDKGAPEAKLKLAQLYIMGIGEDQDYEQAHRLLDHSIRELPQTPDQEQYLNDSDWNLGEALFWKGMLYYYGWGVALNRYRAMEQFKLAQEGFPPADSVVEEGQDPCEALEENDCPYDKDSWWNIFGDPDEDDQFPYAEDEDKYDEWDEDDKELAQSALMGDMESLVKIGNMILEWDGYMPLLDIAIIEDPEYDQLYEEGYEHWRNEEYMDAADSFFTPACNGNTDAMNMIGKCWFEYWNSDNGDIDECLPKAFEWFLKGACNLDENAMYHLGEAYYLGQVPNEDGELDFQSNYEAAAYWFRQAAYQWEHVNPKRCHADAANYLGTMYADGLIDGEKDPVKAVELYRRATELSDRTPGWYNLGMAYAYGNGVPKNRDKAIECLTHAAKFDDKAKEVLKQLGIRY